MISPRKSSFEGGAERREAEDVGLARMHVSGLWQHPSPQGETEEHILHTSSTATEVFTRSFGISAGQ